MHTSKDLSATVGILVTAFAGHHFYMDGLMLF